MDELSAQLGAVLNDPQQMAQIMGLAQKLMGGEAASSAPPPPAAGLGALLPNAAPKGDREALLRALRPYLSESRQRRLDRAIRISIRDVDIVTQYNRQQFLVIMLGTDLSGVHIAVDRIFKSYFRMSGSNAFSPSYSIIGAEKGASNHSDQ